MCVSYVSASLLAALVGFGELVGRYRDEPLDVARRLPAIVYMMLHAAAGLIALVFIDAFGWTFGAPDDAVRLVQIMAAGLAAIMAGVSFEKASQRLTSYCLELMQSVSETEQGDVENRVASLEGSDPDKTSRAQQLGLVLIDVVGENVLRASVEALGDEIR